MAVRGWGDMGWEFSSPMAAGQWRFLNQEEHKLSQKMWLTKKEPELPSVVLRPGLKTLRTGARDGETDVQYFRNATQLPYQVTDRGAFGLFLGYRINQCKHSSRDPTR